MDQLNTIGVTYDQVHIDLMTDNEIENESEKLAKTGYDVTKQNTALRLQTMKAKN
jgi:hypothetical protein